MTTPNPLPPAQEEISGPRPERPTIWAHTSEKDYVSLVNAYIDHLLLEIDLRKEDEQSSFNQVVEWRRIANEALAELSALRSENLELKSLAPRWRLDQAGTSHWEGCWQNHRSCALAKIQEYQAEAVESQQEVVRLKTAATAFLAKLAECEPTIKNFIVLGAIHGVPYTGPKYTEERDALLALAAPTKEKE